MVDILKNRHIGGTKSKRWKIDILRIVIRGIEPQTERSKREMVDILRIVISEERNRK